MKMEVLTFIGFVVGGLIQAASFGYFLGGIKISLADLKERVQALEGAFINRTHS